jgi:hypothetical protein
LRRRELFVSGDKETTPREDKEKTGEFMLDRYIKDYEDEKKHRDRLDEKADKLFTFVTGITGALLVVSTSTVYLAGVSLVNMGAAFIPFVASIALFLASEIVLMNVTKLRRDRPARQPTDLVIVKRNYEEKVENLRQYTIEQHVVAINELINNNNRKASNYQIAQFLAAAALMLLSIALVVSIWIRIASGGS